MGTPHRDLRYVTNIWCRVTLPGRMKSITNGVTLLGSGLRADSGLSALELIGSGPWCFVHCKLPIGQLPIVRGTTSTATANHLLQQAQVILRQLNKICNTSAELRAAMTGRNETVAWK